MEIVNFTGVTKKSFEVARPIKALGFKVAGPRTWLGLSTLFLSVAISSKSGRQIDILDTVPMKDVLAFSQYGEGTHLTLKDAAQTQQILRVNLAPELGVQLANDEELICTLTGLLPEETVQIFGLEAHQAGTNVYDISQLGVQTGIFSREFDVNNAEALMLPNVGGLRKVVITYPNGTVNTYTLDELQMLALEKNDVSAFNIDLTAASAVTILSAVHDAVITLIVRAAVKVEVFSDGAGLTFSMCSIKSRLV